MTDHQVGQISYPSSVHSLDLSPGHVEKVRQEFRRLQLRQARDVQVQRERIERQISHASRRAHSLTLGEGKTDSESATKHPHPACLPSGSANVENEVSWRHSAVSCPSAHGRLKQALHHQAPDLAGELRKQYGPDLPDVAYQYYYARDSAARQRDELSKPVLGQVLRHRAAERAFDRHRNELEQQHLLKLKTEIEELGRAGVASRHRLRPLGSACSEGDGQATTSGLVTGRLDSVGRTAAGRWYLEAALDVDGRRCNSADFDRLIAGTLNELPQEAAQLSERRDRYEQDRARLIRREMPYDNREVIWSSKQVDGTSDSADALWVVRSILNEEVEKVLRDCCPETPVIPEDLVLDPVWYWESAPSMRRLRLRAIGLIGDEIVLELTRQMAYDVAHERFHSAALARDTANNILIDSAERAAEGDTRDEEDVLYNYITQCYFDAQMARQPGGLWLHSQPKTPQSYRFFSGIPFDCTKLPF